MAKHLAQVSHDLGRQVGVLLTRHGSVRNVIVGDAFQLEIPEIGRLRGGTGRFRGLRLVHTHLRNEPLSADDLNDLALLRLDLVAVVQVTKEGLPGRLELSHVLPGTDSGEEPFRRLEAAQVNELDFDFRTSIGALESEFRRLARRGAGKVDQERAILIGVSKDRGHFDETVELARSAGVGVMAEIWKAQKLKPKTILGKGKLQSVILESMRQQADVAIFDVDLRPAQARAFEDMTGLKVIDRTQLILDIFAQRARSRDGKLQVELAQLRYSLPRLTEQDAGLSRLTGGIGGRGPGETVLEIGRRRARDRIRSLEKQVEKLSRQRNVRRTRRRRQGLPVLSIVGYTNAGKSTLLNALTESDVRAADQLFMTLDPTSRRLRFPHRGEVIITDTVGFISDLPVDLKAAFRATLEELGESDLLLQVVDASDSRLDFQIRAVESILEELKLLNQPRLLVLNKIDRVDEPTQQALIRRYGGVPVSATLRSGLERLCSESEEMLRQCGIVLERCV